MQVAIFVRAFGGAAATTAAARIITPTAAAAAEEERRGGRGPPPPACRAPAVQPKVVYGLMRDLSSAAFGLVVFRVVDGGELVSALHAFGCANALVSFRDHFRYIDDLHCVGGGRDSFKDL